MVGVAIWHLSVLVPDRFYGGIIGAFMAAVAGALVSGYLLPSPGIPPHNPPGMSEAIWPIPGAILASGGAYAYGAWREGTPRPRKRTSGKGDNHMSSTPTRMPSRTRE
jgi:hypothetical protein